MDRSERHTLAFVLTIVVSLVTAAAGLIWAGPFMSGALFLTRGTGKAPDSHDLPATYRARHHGHVDVGTGLYIREDEDVILPHTSPFILTRTYLSGDHISRPFGVGTMHNADWYLIGDPATFQWVELILPDGGRIHFDRTSRGTSYATAMFLHRQTPTGFYGARLGWTGLGWAMRFWDGSVAAFRDCSAGGHDLCSLLWQRDADGHVIRFRRNGAGALTAIEGPSDRVSFNYDDDNRIIAATVAGGPRVLYGYDDRGRLIRVESSDGASRAYTYDARDEMLTIREPGWFIENSYDDAGRVTRQVTHLDADPGRLPPKDAVIAFAYVVTDGIVRETDVTEYDGTHTVFRFNVHHYPELEIHDATSAHPIVLSVDRDPVGQFVTGLTVRCIVNGRRTMKSVVMTPGLSEEQAKTVLLTDTCGAFGPAHLPVS